MTRTRNRAQRGSLTTELRRNSSPVWVFRWTERIAGVAVRRKQIVGSKKDLPSKTAAQRTLRELKIDLHSTQTRVHTVREVVEHYRLAELGEHSCKSLRTRQVYGYQLDRVILPIWGEHRLDEVKPVAIEEWFRTQKQAAGTKAKTRCVFSCVFQHALRHDFTAQNPVRLARQGSAPLKEYGALSSLELAALLSELRGVFRTMVYVAVLTGLRRGELVGLRWEDCDLVNHELTVRRSWVDGFAGPPKTLASKRPIPLSDELVHELDTLRQATLFASDRDYVFASPAALGRSPYWPQMVLKRHIRPAAERAGLPQARTIAWHTLRRSTATLLLSSGASIGTAQALLRHASPSMTLGVYSRALTSDKRRGQAGVAAMLEQAASTLLPGTPRSRLADGAA